MLTALAIDGYRSIRSLAIELSNLTVITGANGTGKSSLYRALRLLAGAANDGVISALAAEGGLPSVIWAGPEVVGRAVRQGSAPTQGLVRGHAIALRLGFASDEFSYAIDLGLPQADRQSAFRRDPEIKVESVWSGPILRPATLQSERRGLIVKLRDADGWRTNEARVPTWSSMLSEVADPSAAPELYALRQMVRSWRFYDHIRTDADAPARTSRVGTRTPVLSSDGSDLAAALQTIVESGRGQDLDTAVRRAFPGSGLEVRVDPGSGLFSLAMTQPGMLRPLEAPELSDGTLRYLLWIAALLSPRPASLLVLNEPETSLHPSLLEPLGRLIAEASASSQVIVVSHSQELVTSLAEAGAQVHQLEKEHGQTRVVDRGLLEGPPWHWPKR